MGAGTFVRRTAVEVPEVLAGASAEHRLGRFTCSRTSSRPTSDRVIAEMERQAHREDLIPLMVGYPADGMFPASDLAEILGSVAADQGARAHQYGDVEGVPELREQLAVLGREQGFADSPDEIVTSAGAAHALSLVAWSLLRPGDVAAIESPSFPGSLDHASRHGRVARRHRERRGRTRRGRAVRPRPPGADQARVPAAPPPQPDWARPLRRAARAPDRAGSPGGVLHRRGRRLRRPALRG